MKKGKDLSKRLRELKAWNNEVYRMFSHWLVYGEVSVVIKTNGTRVIQP